MKDTLKILHLHFNANSLVYVVRGFFFSFYLRGWEQGNFVGKIFEGFSFIFFLYMYFFFVLFSDIPTASILFSQQRTHSVPFSYFLRNHSEIACSTRARTHLCKLRIFEGKPPLSLLADTSVFSHLLWFSQSF